MKNENITYNFEVLLVVCTVRVTDIGLKSIFLSPDSNHMTHGTWQIDQHWSC
jgi:hypothetical protein